MHTRESRSTRPRKALYAILSCFPLIYSAQGFARPDMQPLGPNIADKGSTFYHFSVSQFDSADGARHYRVWTAVPNKAAPPSGYPVLYMLDGNAVMDRLSDELFKQLTEQSPPVIVGVGYQTNLPFDLNSRSYDYTPAVRKNNETYAGRKSGGSEDFRQLLETRIAVKAEQGLQINPQRRALWGHSYGGLLVLDSWLSSSYFQSYYSASPSLGRDNFALLNRITAVTPASYCAKKLVIMEGSATPGDKRDSNADQVLTKVNTAMTTLKKKGVDAAVWDFPGQGHGPMFNASFRSALLDISREKAEGKQGCH
ncbi:alpha/beta hydrolase [Klebsiella aerogenes]|uniref:alpha/beta hydrolase n=1 Tax=Klebsiella aerogenes TaxID=548 RepID=UPI0022784B3A|nr:alpha/beta hydrolase [Klebsiella aerogenes]EKZ5285690.1 alpha/beta hydrolase [Klebsiella aerogenes]MCR1573185.1 alpha/beta hydrolase [Klebsiella aerogenes]MCY4763727.1 alpha/beta hydrolase [Klebsiella aerogenes]MDT4310876.1 alpha/beta hydrolase [Klebsiella aerogenes]